ncbi:MAG: tetratricopeptide repeat protein [Pirellulales bacterium]
MRFSFPMQAWGGMLLALTGATFLGMAAEPETPAPVAAARQLMEEGKHAEAEEAFRALDAEFGVASALGVARCQEATGRREKATRTLTEAAKAHPNVPTIPAELARLALARGDYQAAEAFVAAALKLDAEGVLAHWVRAELLSAAGKLTEANADYQWLVKYYNDHNVEDAEDLHWIGLGAGQFARWNRLSDQFNFLVNEFYPDVLKADPACWRAHYEAGRLFAEKYNEAEAAREYKAALALNPNAAEVHAALGEMSLDQFELTEAQAACDQALAINPQLLVALHLKADIHLANFEPRQCVGVLNDVLKLHPTSEETLGRLAAAYLAVDGPATSRFGKLAGEVTARNPHAGRFYLALADALDRLRRWPAAAGYYREAMARMPQLIASSGRLGMMLMRLGEEAEARKVLDESIEADPFNVRVNNTLKVLEVLDAYETIETEHFRIRFDPKKDGILARYMGQWLEEVYPQLVKQMGFAPPEKSLFEVFCQARNTDGHGWFSARMVGLPRIHPIGACAGKIVAMQSPSEGKQRFNWARVVKHEFIHVINLQQTDFNIPHWFTEALAVLNEGYPRPQEWNELLVESSAKGKLFNLDTINLGFIRPHSSVEWTLAYCQAELYAEYVLERFGPDAIAKMLAAYADNLTTPEALERAFDVNQPDFERGYQEFVKKIVAGLPAAAGGEMSLVELQKALAEKPKDPELLAKTAQARLNRRNYPEARRLADAALAIEPKNQLAQYVRARLHLLVGENKEALARLEESLDREHPQKNLLALLAGLKLASEDFKAAADLYELGAKNEPQSAKWLKSLAAVYLKSGDDKKLAGVLLKLAEADPDDLPVRKKLAQLALAAGDWPAAQRWTLEGLHVQVMDAELHAWRGEAFGGQGNAAEAAKEYAVAVELNPDDAKSRLALARSLVKADQPAEAKAALEELLKRDPSHSEAKKMLESLE